MIVDGLYRKNVCYIVAERLDNGVIEAVGTAFFVYCHAGPNALVHYAVTAAHVIAQDPAYAGYFFRVNRRDGGFEDLPLLHEDWICHPTADLAICHADFIPKFDTFSIPDWEICLSNADPGQDVFFIGLFVYAPGTRTVDALVRFGKVCYPKTEVLNSNGENYKAFLIEGTVIGGASGSPVFLHDEHYVKPEVNPLGIASLSTIQRSRVMASHVRPPLLGVIQGRFRDREWVMEAGIETDSSVDVGAGIAIVTPSEQIPELLAHPRFVAEREAKEKEAERIVRAKGTPKPAGLQ
jgi:hypothetical protein